MSQAAPPVEGVWSDRAIWGVGRYTVAGRTRLWPSTRAERASAAGHATRHLGALGIGQGDLVLLVSRMSEGVQAVPVEDAIANLDAVLCPADGTVADSRRVTSLLRTFPLGAVLGLGPSTLEGCRQLDIPLSVFERAPILVADHDAVGPLRSAGLDPFGWRFLGPCLAIECGSRAGLHVDGDGWRVTEVGGELVLRPRLAGPGEAIRDDDPVSTGVAGEVTSDPCWCGSRDPRVLIDSGAFA
ncbi:MAG TPA: hypothetical protein VHU85_15105 [Acidimicrobiales bacterium]|jgi:hypothetical protein|nr:hypothetical protein [Acidimicrobiales bacterium]